MEREPAEPTMGAERGAGHLIIWGVVAVVLVTAAAAVVAFGLKDDEPGGGGSTAERCDLGFNTAAYNATAPKASPGDIEHHSLHGEEPVTFTVAEWAATFTDESLGVPASAVAAGTEANPMIRDSVLSGQLTTTLEPDPWVPLDDRAECDRLAGELRQARAAAARYPTVADALAAGYIEVSIYAPGQGAHYLKMSAMDGTFDPDEPEMLSYAGNAPDATIMGMAYNILAPDGLPVDVGFTGPNDRWHRHVSLCLNADQVAVPESECDAGRATRLPDMGGWMTHAWLVPGCESDWGVFSGANPRVVVIPVGTVLNPGCNSGRTIDGPLGLDPTGTGPAVD